MKSEHRAPGDADAIVWNHAEDQCAGRHAGSIDHDAVAGVADLVEQVEERTNFSTHAAEDAHLGACRHCGPCT
jgi:hypothetical protein